MADVTVRSLANSCIDICHIDAYVFIDIVLKRKKFQSAWLFFWSVICAAILAIHYNIQLTVVRQGLLNNETSGLWLLATPNPHSLFWTLAAYGFMGMSLLSASFVFNQKIRLLLATNGRIGIMFLIGNALGIFVINILASFSWGILFPTTCSLIANTFKQSTNRSKTNAFINPS